MSVVQACLSNLIAVLGIFIDLKIADLDYGLILADINTAQVYAISACIGILRTDIEKAVLTPGCFGDIDRVFVAFFLLIGVVTRLRLVDRGRVGLRLLRISAITVRLIRAVSLFLLSRHFRILLARCLYRSFNSLSEYNGINLFQIHI